MPTWATHPLKITRYISLTQDVRRRRTRQHTYEGMARLSWPGWLVNCSNNIYPQTITDLSTELGRRSSADVGTKPKTRNYFTACSTCHSDYIMSRN